MIGIGWTEMLVIGVVALIFIGPKELPALMQKMGKAIGAIRRMGSEFQREINRSTGLDTVTDLRKTFTDPIKKTTAEIAREFNKITPTGVEPSGVIKPADPKSPSVVKEIRAAAGLETPAAPIKTAAVGAGAAAMAGAAPAEASPPATAAPDAEKPAKHASTRVKAPPRATPAPTLPVETADLFPVTPPPEPEPVKKTPRPRAKKPVESPAPIEALAPATPPAPKKRKAAAKPKPKPEEQT